VRAIAGPALLHLGFLAAGLGFLRAAGVVRAATLPVWLAAAGLAYLAGVVAVVLVCIALLVVGVPLSFGEALVICVVLALPFLLELRGGAIRRRPALRVPQLAPEQWVAALALFAVGVVAVIGVLTLGVKAVDEWDAWNLWTRKAVLLVHDGQLPLDVFSGAAYATSHPDYPLLLPVLEALHLRSTGRLEPWNVHVAIWLLLACFIWAMAFLGSRVTRPIVWALLPAAAALLSISELLSGLADVPLAYLLCLAVLALALFLEGERRSDLALGALFLAGAASMKNEGLPGAVFALGATFAVLVVGRRRRLLAPFALAAAAVVAVGIAPWRLWLAAHDITGDIPVAKGVDPSYLFSAARWDRVWPSVEALHGQLTNTATASIFVPLALALVVLRVRGRHRSPVAAFYLGAGVLYAASLVWAYWISPLDLVFHIQKSVSRIYVGVAFIALAATVHLIGRPPVTLSEADAGPPRRASAEP
jgi:hypothetical protein